MSLISIIIPFKNTASFIEECLNSIKRQTVSNWEIIAVDDGSMDDSVAIVKRFQKEDARIQLHKNTAEGIIPALRTGFAYAMGDFITRMDSDDIMLPNRLELMSATLKSKGVGHVAVGQVKYFSQTGISDGYAKYEKWLNELIAEGRNYQEIYKECVIPSPCWMVHRGDFLRAGGFDDDRYPEDYDLTFRFYATGLRIIPCQEVLHLWRDYSERTSRNHEHYAQNYFLDIKLHYYLKLDYDPHRPLAIWGAGNKGKAIAKKLNEKVVPFSWYCDNPKKIGKKIYGVTLRHFTELQKEKDVQSIVTVANEMAQSEIRHYLSKLGQEEAIDFFFFC